MHRGLAFVTLLLLPLCGCAAIDPATLQAALQSLTPPTDGSADPSAADPSGGADPGAPAGYSDASGTPMMADDSGQPQQLVQENGQVGYHDRYHHFHRAPDSVRRHYEQRSRMGFGHRDGRFGGNGRFANNGGRFGGNNGRFAGNGPGRNFAGNGPGRNFGGRPGMAGGRPGMMGGRPGMPGRPGMMPASAGRMVRPVGRAPAVNFKKHP
jgi:hypothetical protein